MIKIRPEDWGAGHHIDFPQDDPEGIDSFRIFFMLSIILNIGELSSSEAPVPKETTTDT
jgi:hypothetical protein